jgi:hypothetical protein
MSWSRRSLLWRRAEHRLSAHATVAALRGLPLSRRSASRRSRQYRYHQRQQRSARSRSPVPATLLERRKGSPGYSQVQHLMGRYPMSGDAICAIHRGHEPVARSPCGIPAFGYAPRNRAQCVRENPVELLIEHGSLTFIASCRDRISRAARSRLAGPRARLRSCASPAG